MRLFRIVINSKENAFFCCFFCMKFGSLNNPLYIYIINKDDKDMTTQEIINEVKENYEGGYCYVECEYNDNTVKFRINKDHARNHGRNDDNDVHNLSLVSAYANGSDQDSYFQHETVFNGVKLQKQVFGVMDWEDVESEVRDFLFDIDYI